MGASKNAKHRYLVTFEFANGIRDTVSVWASSRATAMEAARSWLEFSQDYPASEAVRILAEVLGDEASGGDIGVAASNRDVNHQRFSSEGELVHTLFHGVPDEVHRLTSMLRESNDGNWPLIRSLLKQEGVEAGDAAVVGSWDWRPDRPQHATIVTRSGNVYLFSDGSSPADNPKGPRRRDPDLLKAPSRDDWTPDIELGFELLKDQSL